MKYPVALFAVALLVAMPAGAQLHQQTHPGATHVNRPVMPARPVHVAHPVVRHVNSRHVTTHHVVYHHRYPVTVHARHVHHVAHVAARPAFHRAPAAVLRLRRNVVAVHRFHAGPYRALPGWRYRRWVFGEHVPAIYFARDYWITDFLAFGLFAPPDGYTWVRYGPDALLIDEYTGEIIQVDYGVFY